MLFKLRKPSFFPDHSIINQHDTIHSLWQEKYRKCILCRRHSAAPPEGCWSWVLVCNIETIPWILVSGVINRAVASLLQELVFSVRSGELPRCWYSKKIFWTNVWWNCELYWNMRGILWLKPRLVTPYCKLCQGIDIMEHCILNTHSCRATPGHKYGTARAQGSWIIATKVSGRRCVSLRPTHFKLHGVFDVAMPFKTQVPQWFFFMIIGGDQCNIIQGTHRHSGGFLDQLVNPWDMLHDNNTWTSNASTI